MQSNKMPYGTMSREQERVRAIMTSACFASISVAALIIQLIWGYMLAWTVIGGMSVVMTMIQCFTANYLLADSPGR